MLIDSNNMDTVSTVTQGTAVAVASTMSNHISTICTSMLPWFYVAVPLIALDLYYGRKVATTRYKSGKSTEEVTIQKSLKMTVQKIFNYIGWILLSCTLSLAFNTEYIIYIIMGLIYGMEVLSLINKWGKTKNLEIDEIGVIRLFFLFIWQKVCGSTEEFAEIVRKSGSVKRTKKNKKGEE